MSLPKTPVFLIFTTFFWLLTTLVRADFRAGTDAYERGDYATAFKEWQPLAIQGEAKAQFKLGAMYANGQGVLKDYNEALRWYRLAAEQGDAKAQNNLGIMNYLGQGGPQDYVQASMWFILAAGQGQKYAAETLDEITKKMTPLQIAEVRRRARQWLIQHQK